MKILFALPLAFGIQTLGSAWAASKTDYCDQHPKDGGAFEIVCDQGNGPEIVKRWLADITSDTFVRARAGDPKASVLLGEFYEFFRKDYVAALFWYRKAADVGDDMGMMSIGRLYTQGLGVPLDGNEALKWFSAAASHGSGMAMYWAADDEENVLHNPKEAERWYRLSADHGTLLSMQRLSFLYEYGASGFAKDLTQAALWHRAAADAGDIDALYRVGKDFETGHGVPKDETMAAHWYLLGVQADEGNSMEALSRMYREGRGVARNDAEAERLHALALTKAPPVPLQPVSHH